MICSRKRDEEHDQDPVLRAPIGRCPTSICPVLPCYLCPFGPFCHPEFRGTHRRIPRESRCSVPPRPGNLMRARRLRRGSDPRKHHPARLVSHQFTNFSFNACRFAFSRAPGVISVLLRHNALRVSSLIPSSVATRSQDPRVAFRRRDQARTTQSTNSFRDPPRALSLVQR